MPKSGRRIDGQMTGLAGELFVAAELLKRGIQTSVTFGNAKSIDLLAYNPANGKTFTVQVKALRKKNYFLIDPSKIDKNHVYVFVLLNEPGTPAEYFIANGKQLAEERSRFDLHPKLPGVHPKKLEDLRDNWSVFLT